MRMMISYLGVDTGSTTVKAVLLDEKQNIIYKRYERHFSQIKETLYTILKDMEEILKDSDVKVAITGSGGMKLAEDLGIPFIQEVLAGSKAVKNYIPHTDVAIELGGEDAKITFFEEILDQLGQMPLPPYITHQLKDKNRYQTVYAKHEGSAAAPTAGLHFTKELLQQVQDAGVKIAHVTLHVGLGTFRPVKVEDVTQHHMHSEFYVVEEDQAKLINDTKAAGGRVIAVGTTSCRTLESATGEDGILKAGSGWTEIFIYPGYRFKMIDGLITNFHLPESTLVMLVSALAGKEHIMAAYEEAVREKYRFFSFGDAMMIE